MIKSITNFLIIFFIFQQLKSQISQIYQNGYNAFCDKTLQILIQTFMKAEDREDIGCQIGFFMGGGGRNGLMEIDKKCLELCSYSTL